MLNKKGSSTISIRAAVSRGAGRPLKIERLEMDLPRDDEVLVRLVASGICHTDIGFMDSSGSILGHEGAGIVEQVGGHVKGLRRGDHVVLSYQSCGRCRSCRGSRPADCEHFWEANFGFARFDGSSAYHGDVRGHFFGQSSFATHTLATERNIVKVSRTLPLDLLAPLGCGLQTGAGTVMNSLAVKARSSVAVFGTGAVGLAAVMAAKIVGAKTIIGVDINPRRLKLALDLGATHTINSRKDSVIERIKEITGGGIDYIVEDTGDQELYRFGIDLLNPNGTMAILTGGSGTDSLPGGRRVISVIQGDAVPQRFIPKLIGLYKRGKFPFDRLVKFYNFSEINRAVADAERGATIKPVVRIGKPG